jgi:hypothetical protein
MRKNDVVSIVTLTGEFVGKYVDETPDQYVIDDPRLLTQTQEGAAFIPAVCMTGKTEPNQVIFNKSTVVFIIETADEVQKEYRKATTGLII